MYRVTSSSSTPPITRPRQFIRPGVEREIVGPEHLVNSVITAPLNLAEVDLPEPDKFSPWFSKPKQSSRFAIRPHFWTNFEVSNRSKECTTMELSINGSRDNETVDGDLLVGTHLYATVPGIIHPRELEILNEEEQYLREEQEQREAQLQQQQQQQQQGQHDIYGGSIGPDSDPQTMSSLMMEDNAMGDFKKTQMMLSAFQNEQRPFVAYVPSLGSVLYQNVELKFGKSDSLSKVSGRYLELTNWQRGIDRSDYNLVGRRHNISASWLDSKKNHKVGVRVLDWAFKQGFPLSFLTPKQKVTYHIQLGNINSLWQSDAGAGHEQTGFYPINRNTRSELVMSDFDHTLMSYVVTLNASDRTTLWTGRPFMQNTKYPIPQQLLFKREYLVEQIVETSEAVSPAGPPVPFRPDELARMEPRDREYFDFAFREVMMNNFDQWMKHPRVVKRLKKHVVVIRETRPIKMITFAVQTHKSILNNDHFSFVGTRGRPPAILAGLDRVTIREEPDKENPNVKRTVEKRETIYPMAEMFVYANIHSHFFGTTPTNNVYSIPIMNESPLSPNNMGCLTMPDKKEGKSHLELLLKLQPDLNDYCDIKVWLSVWNKIVFKPGSVSVDEK